ncbi:MAG: WbqC family protein [Pseudomonadales bacterium]|nr:WbqC family protein [Pseudomonadales bacterium]
MRVAIMQPYFMPYIGYFQLMGSVDVFVIYDNIKYTKKGWINRNRLLQNGGDAVFSLPLASDSDSLDIAERSISPAFSGKKMLNVFRGAYARAPNFSATYGLLEKIVCQEERNLFRFLRKSVRDTAEYIGIPTRIVTSSDLAVDRELRSQDKVLAICKVLGADTYVNAIGGQDLYSPGDFLQQGIALKFIRSRPFEYRQFGAAFVPWLSIIDVLMFNPVDAVRSCVETHYDLI